MAAVNVGEGGEIQKLRLRTADNKSSVTLKNYFLPLQFVLSIAFSIPNSSFDRLPTTYFLSLSLLPEYVSWLQFASALRSCLLRFVFAGILRLKGFMLT